MLALTGLRIVAALWVVAFHFHFTPMAGVERVNDWLGPLVTQGALGVDLFFVLSGFVIAWTYLDQLGPRLRAGDAGRFVWARAARMWPAYAVVFHLFGVWLAARMVFGSTTDVAYQAVQPSYGVAAWLEQLVLVQMWTEPYLDGASWVGPTWSISAEWLAYLLFPVLALGFFRLRNLPFAVLAAGSLLCVAPVAAAFLVVGSPYYPYSWLVRILGGFSAGVLAMLAVRRLRDTERLRATASSAATFAAVGVPFVLLAGTVAGGGLHGLAVLLFPVLVGALVLADRGPVHHLLTRGPMVHGGRISYALYLVHIPLFEIFWFLSDSGVLPRGGETGHLIALTVFVGTLPVAHLLYSLVERPARRWMRARPPVRTEDPRTEAPHVPAAPPVPPAPRFVDTDEARRDPETSVLPVVAAEPVTSVLPVVPAAPAVRSAPVEDVLPETEALPVIPRRRVAGPAVATSSGWTPSAAPLPAPGGDADTLAMPVVRRAEPAPAVAAPAAPVAEPEPTAPAAAPAPAEPVVVPAPATPTRAPRRTEEAPAEVPAAAEAPATGVEVPAPTGSARWVLERLAAARAADFDGAGGTDVAADLVAVARMRSGGPGTGTELFTPLVENPGGPSGVARMERLRSLQLAARELADDRGVVPAPRAIRSAAALPGSRTGAEHCGRGARRRDDAHASAATPIVAASGAAARRRRKKPSHGA
ncbi:acyltransferase family protein [Pseudonocardia spirodelae]|uniref:Acyltransferase family protein n=1 Tax=Pseudonocardia spirodelae TaxID=3133431 RepID=A0ABU8T4A3_9PSEU